MPKAMTYKPNSVIYFKGDHADKVFILKSGRISLNSNDIETGEEIHDYIQTGEFFGVKSALGKYKREENAVVLSDAAVVQFSVPEFEQLISQNHRIIMKMLKVFSNQLRRIHTKVRSMLSQEEYVDPEKGLYNIGQYYLKQRRFPQAVHTFRKYIALYPEGTFLQDARKGLESAERSAQGASKPRPGNAGPAGAERTGKTREQASDDSGDATRRFYEGESLLGQEKYQDAIAAFKQAAAEIDDEEYKVKSLFEIGRCLYFLKAYEKAIKHLSTLIQKYPRMPGLGDALFYVGKSYEDSGETKRAEGFYRKILSLPNVDDSLKRKVHSQIKGMS